MPLNVRNGIAPAMKADGKLTYWGKMVGDVANDNLKKLLGIDLELSTPGDNQEKTHERQEALDIVEDPANRGLNARQLILKYKQPHASGEHLTFPSRSEIAEVMSEFEDECFVDIFGDGSVTTPHQMVGGPRRPGFVGTRLEQTRRNQSGED